ncbi:MAG TPA: SMC family ATPase [Virgibacillus sp.]|nr:SMC family ATPase [Virgibacillus sp.]
MQPLKLTMTAFGPYKERETIDFEKLGDHKLFVISGNTGAGKTTIFDGICFALFGSASGTDRDNHAMLRSDFADDDTHTSVELTFELNQRTYRIFRQLGHQKQGNKSKTGDRIELYEIRTDKEVPCVDRQNVSDVDKKVEELLGLTEDQFKQIVMLPQGEFRKLLTSKTENKEAILRRLFKTESYQEMNERLKMKKDAAEENYRRIAQTRDMYIQNIPAHLPERENSLLFQVITEDYYNSHQIIAGLEEEVAFYEERIQIDDAHYKKAYNMHDEKQTTFHKAQMINQKFTIRDEKRKQLGEMNDKVSIFDKKEQTLKLAERASHITLYEKQVNEWQHTEKEKRQELVDSEKAKQLADEQYRKMLATYEYEKNNQVNRDDIKSRIERLGQFLPVVKDIDAKQNELNQLKTNVKQGHARLEDMTSKLQAKTKELETYEKKVQQLERNVDALPSKEEKLQEMRDQARVLRNFLQQKERHTNLKKDLKQKQTMYEKAKNDYDGYEKKWLNDQASVLASHLHEGEACPVCGSTSHPDKVIADHQATTKEMLQKMKTELEQKNNAYLTVNADMKSCLGQLEEASEELKANGISPEQANTTYDRLIEEGKRLGEEVNQLKQIRNELTQFKNSIYTLKDEEKKLKVAQEKENEKVQSQNLALTKQQTIFEENLRDVPEKVRNLTELEKQMDVLKNQQEKMEKAWDKAQKDLQVAKDHQTTVTSNVAHARKQLEETVSKREKADKAFHQALEDASFSTIERYQEAKMEPNDQQALKKDIENFKQSLLVLTQEVEQLSKELKNESHHDLQVLETELGQLKHNMEEALKKRDRSRNYHAEAKKLLDNIVTASENVKTQEETLRVIADLYDVMRGQNSQKISFERYLQIEYLEQIIDTANLRLKNLSNGQFLLMRSDRQESHGRQSGLAFDVYDAYTGQTRDVKTLSGGEKFNTSLCLALGMSDVIQSFQGNVSMKTMFIDEGFGSLDEESLHKALDALIELQKSGRTIGVISHVEELKAILPAALEVTKTKEGSSRTAFVLK